MGGAGEEEEEEEMKQVRLLDFQLFLSNGKHSDVLLKSDDTTFPCHKVVLAASSTVFDRMLDLNMMESQTGEVEISDVDPNTLKQLLEFIYTGQVEDAAYTPELLYAADKYEIHALVKIF